MYALKFHSILHCARKIEKFMHIEKIFRQNDSFMNFFSKTLLSRNFGKKSQWKLRKITQHFLKIFVKMLKLLYCMHVLMFSRNTYFPIETNFLVFYTHTQCVKTGNSLPRKFFSVKSIYSKVTVWKSSTKSDHDFYEKMNIFSVKSTQKVKHVNLLYKILMGECK